MRLPKLLISSFFIGTVFFTSYAGSEIKIKFQPNKQVPQQFILENDSLSVCIKVGRYIYFTSFVDKISGVEFINPEKPAPIVKMSSQWHLLQVGFNIWQVRELKSKNEKGVEIELFSNYLENPYHLFIRLWLSESQELRLDLSVEHQADEKLHDMRYVTRPMTTIGLSFLKYFKPNGSDDPYVIFKKGLSYFHNDTTDVGMYFLRQSDAPTFPLVVSYPEMNSGVLLNKHDSDLEWSFSTAKKTLSFMQHAPIHVGETFVIFKGTLRPFRGNWHVVLRWWKGWLRSQLDLKNYQRPGHLEYRKKVVGNFTMAFDHEFYDPINNRYRLRDFLERGEREFGGYDFILFWHGYPRLGVDSRDEWAMYQGLPGGIEGVQNLVKEANQQEVLIFLSFNPWDVIGNRKNLTKAQAEIMAKTGANGSYLDIMRGASDDFRRIFDEANPDIVFSSENRPPFEGLQYSTGSQEDHEYVMEMPRIDLLKFVLPEHNISNTERMGRNRMNQIRNTIFNFVGFTVWEDIFGEINRYSWDERILITRYNLLVHDHIDAFLSLNPLPLIPPRPVAKSAGATPYQSAWQSNPVTHDHPYPPDKESYFSGLYVNTFPAENKILYSLYHKDHDNVDRFHDNRIIGRLFQVDFIEDWHLVNIWDGLPAKVIEYNGERWAYVETELPDASCVFAAMPKIISITKNDNFWSANTVHSKGGELRLVGMDAERRPIYKPAVPASNGLQFGSDDVEPNVNGYIMIQYLKYEVVKDVIVVKIKS